MAVSDQSDFMMGDKAGDFAKSVTLKRWTSLPPPGILSAMSAVALALLPFLPVPVRKFLRKIHGPQLQQWLFGGWTLLVFAFLYVPILLLVVFSFNDSKLNIQWEG